MNCLYPQPFMNIGNRVESHIRAERTARYAGLDLPEEFVAPNYSGRSIVNVPASIIALFGGEPHADPLDPAILGALGDGIERVILVVVDALGYGRLRDTLNGNARNGFRRLVKQGGQLVPLTSVFPSTTTAALTSIWSGFTPAEHGMLGYRLFLREASALANMISFSPVYTGRLGGEQLIASGLDPDRFMPVPSLPETLAPLGVPVYHWIEHPYVTSALSRVQMRGVKETHGYVTSSDLWVSLREGIEQHTNQRALFTAYWSAIDSISHVYGPSHSAVEAEVNNFAYSFQREFLDRLGPEARRGTLLLMTADHGQTAASPQQIVNLRGHPELRARLVFSFAGESRAAYLYCRNGEVQAVREYCETRLGSKFHVLDARQALEEGLFGEGEWSPETLHRVGDLVLVSRGADVLWDRDDLPRERGRHGGLLAEEMFVPLLAARLDA